MKRALFGAALLWPVFFSFSTGGSQMAQAQKALPSYPCGCVIHISNISGQTSVAGAGVLNSTSPPNQATASQCQSACASWAAPYVHPQALSQSTATQACAAGAQNGALIRAYYKTTGMLQTNPFTNTYQPAVALGVLVKTPGTVTQGWRCPAPWLSNTSNQPGGFTGDQRCKRLAGSITISPLPADGTQISSWGFTWGNEVWAYGTAANGGAASYTSITTPAQCHFS